MGKELKRLDKTRARDDSSKAKLKNVIQNYSTAKWAEIEKKANFNNIIIDEALGRTYCVDINNYLGHGSGNQSSGKNRGTEDKMPGVAAAVEKYVKCRMDPYFMDWIDVDGNNIGAKPLAN